MTAGGPVHSFLDDALGDLDAVGLAAEIRAGRISRSEAAEAAIARTEKVNPQLSAVQIECFSRARDTGAQEGAFSGVPSFVKDNTDVTGLPTCHGSAAITPRPARHTSAPGAQFLAQGFVLLGKSTLPEFGLTASTEYSDRPPTRNPWNVARSVGASSGGAAALVASGAVPIAHANDGGGSIRIPAAASGLVGLKVTRARLLDRPGSRQLPVNLVAEGVVSRSVRDTAHYVAAAELYRPHRKLRPIGLVEGPADRRLRIGILRTDVRHQPVHPQIAAVLDSAAKAFADAGHEIVPQDLTLDPRFITDFKLYWSMFAVLMSAAFAAEHRRGFDPRRLDPFTKGLATHIRRNPHALPAAIRRLRGGTRIYAEQFRDVDVILSPVLSTPPPALGELAPDQPFEALFGKLLDYVGFTPVNNVGGGPAISLPHTMMADGLPGSVQLSAPMGGERTLLELAYELEAVSPFPRIQDAGWPPPSVTLTVCRP